MSDFDVVVAGMGMVGSALAMECGHRNVRCLCVEPRKHVDGYTLRHPRAKLANVRSMSHLRRWGLADSLRQLDPLPGDWPMRAVFTTSVTGRGLATFNDVFGGRSRSDAYPEAPQWIPQPIFEAHLRRAATAKSSVSVASGQRVVGYRQEGDRFTVEIEAEGRRRCSVTTRFLVGCDGAHSAIRSMLGVAMQGTTSVLRGLGIVFRLLEEVDAVIPAIHYWCINGNATALGGPLDDKGHWFLQAHLEPGVDPGDVDVDPLISEFLGAPLRTEILDVSLWEADELIADAYRIGPIFLAGDAAHLHPPYGGHGANTGIEDAVNLGWKLGAVVAGWGGNDLLASYEVERRPAAQRVIDVSVSNARMLGPDLLSLAFGQGFDRTLLDADGSAGEEARRRLAARIGPEKEQEFRSLGIVLGLRYEDSPIIVRDSTPQPADERCTYQPTGRPGALAPHAWLTDGSSLYDHFGDGFTLLSFEDADPAAATRVHEVAASAGLPLSVCVIREDAVRRLYEAPLTLIRPDQYVAWCGHDVPAAEAVLDCVRGARGLAGPASGE